MLICSRSYVCLSALVSSTPFLKNQLYILSSRNPPWIRINSQTTAQSPTCLSYPKSLNLSSNLDLLNTLLLTIFSTLTSLRTVNITPLKLLLSIFTIISLMPLAHRKYPVSVLLTSQQLSTPLITIS